MNLIYIALLIYLINATNELIISLTHQPDLSRVRVRQHRTCSLLPPWRGIFSSQLVPGFCELSTISNGINSYLTTFLINYMLKNNHLPLPFPCQKIHSFVKGE